MTAMAEIKTGSKPVYTKEVHTGTEGADQAGTARVAVETGGFEFNDAALAALNARAGRGIVRGLAAQAIMGCAAALVSWAVAGSAAGLSALLGDGASFVPQALFAPRFLLALFGARDP